MRKLEVRVGKWVSLSPTIVKSWCWSEKSGMWTQSSVLFPPHTHAPPRMVYNRPAAGPAFLTSIRDPESRVSAPTPAPCHLVCTIGLDQGHTSI